MSNHATPSTIGRNTVRTVQDATIVQYANGKTVARALHGAGRFMPFVGFHAEAGKDSDFDAALQHAGIPLIEIKHQRQGGANIVRHWCFGEKIAFYPITSGPVAPTVATSLSDRNAHDTAEAGIGLRWGQGERSRMAIRGYLDCLVRAGALYLVQISVKSRMTDVLLAALLDHGRACEAADSLIDRKKHPDLVSYHEVALPLGAGEEQEWGKGDTATVVPFVSLHPAQVDAAYLRSRWRPEIVQGAALTEWASIQAWAHDYASQGDRPMDDGSGEEPRVDYE